MYCSTSPGAVRLSATLAISPSVMRGLWITASWTSLLGSRRRMVRTSLFPFLFAHSIFLAMESLETFWAMVSRFPSAAASCSGVSAIISVAAAEAPIFRGTLGDHLGRPAGSPHPQQRLLGGAFLGLARRGRRQCSGLVDAAPE